MQDNDDNKKVVHDHLNLTGTEVECLGSFESDMVRPVLWEQHTPFHS